MEGIIWLQNKLRKVCYGNQNAKPKTRRWTQQVMETSNALDLEEGRSNK